MYLQRIRLKKNTTNARGFTLVETMVAVGLFAIVTTITSSAFLVMVNADRLSRSVRIATDNLSLALEDMSRRIKTGSVYNCDGVTLSGTQDCVTGGTRSLFSFNDQNGVRTVYRRGVGPGPVISDPNLISGCGGDIYTSTQGCILRAVSPDGPRVVTSHEIDIKALTFFAEGTTIGGGDIVQPYVVLLMEGLVQGSQAVKTQFKMETMVTQRQLDI